MRRLLPYSNMQSLHLGMLLLVARILAMFGWLIVGLAVLMLVGFWLAAQVQFHISVLNAGPLSIGMIEFGFAMVIISGVLAALVAIEENMRRNVDAS